MMMIIINNTATTRPTAAAVPGASADPTARRRDKNRKTRPLEPRNVVAGVTSLDCGGVSYPAGAWRARAGALE